MKRSTLKDIIAEAAKTAGVGSDATRRLVATADPIDGIDRILVGDFEATIDGVKCGCPAQLAGFVTEMADGDIWIDPRVDGFPHAFDALVIGKHADALVDNSAYPSDFIEIED